MRIYIELIENVGETAEEGDFIRVDVTDWVEEDIDVLINELRRYAQRSYTSYTMQKHYCNHDQNRSCDVEAIA